MSASATGERTRRSRSAEARRAAAYVLLVVQRGAHELQVLAPDVLGGRRQHVVPDRGERAPELRHPCRPGHEPDVAVLAALAPAADVHVADAGYPRDGSLDLQQERSELGCELVAQVG